MVKFMGHDLFNQELGLEEPQYNSVLETALAKIEQAKLYESLLRNPIFDADAAKPELIAQVTNEVKEFALQRLQILVGEGPVQPDYTPFTAEEITALKTLAGRLLSVQKDPNTNIAVSASQAHNARSMSTPKPRVQRTQQPKSATPTQPRTRGRRRSENLSNTTGKDYAQAISDQHKPTPMPSATAMNQQFAEWADQMSGQMNGSDIGKILQAAIAVAQRKNAHITEE